jgi:altronate dehydratase
MSTDEGTSSNSKCESVGPRLRKNVLDILVSLDFSRQVSQRVEIKVENSVNLYSRIDSLIVFPTGSGQFGLNEVKNITRIPYER